MVFFKNSKKVVEENGVEVNGVLSIITN